MPARAATVNSIAWDSQPQYNRFIMQFDELPKYNTVDSLQQSKLFYVDVYGLKQSYNHRLLQVDDNTLKYVDALSYPEHGVLRLVFYTKEGTSSFKVQTVNDPPRLVIDTVREGSAQPAAAPNAQASASQMTGSANLTVNATPVPAASALAQASFAPSTSVPNIPQPSSRPRSTGSSTRKIVIIDPGHGGANSGAKSRAQVNGQSVLEKDLALQFAYQLKKAIDSSPNMVALVTRVDDSNVGLQERVQFAEKNEGDLFVSLHMNDGAGNSNARGLEVYFMNDKATVDGAARAVEERENVEVGSATKKNGNSLLKELMTGYERDRLLDWQYESSAFCRHLEQAMLTIPYYSANYRGIKSANFAVLKNFMMPAVLLEIGFITNAEDLKFLVNPEFQQVTAIVVFNAINSYFAYTDQSFKPQQRNVSFR
ncbi:MAG: N-acetylmuramoyl-L-alanine amidase family protein [Candidatus Sumerlaeaceae bacterium]